MSDEATVIAETERRLSYAVERLSRGMEQLLQIRAELEADLARARAETAALTEAMEQATAPGGAPAANSAADPEEMALRDARIATLEVDLASEREARSAAEEALTEQRARHEAQLSALEKRLGQRARATTLMQAEVGQLKQSNEALIGANHQLLAARGALTAQLVDDALRAELEAMQAARAAESRELDEILSQLEPLLARHAAPVAADAAADAVSGQPGPDTAEEEDTHA